MSSAASIFNDKRFRLRFMTGAVFLLAFVVRAITLAFLHPETVTGDEYNYWKFAQEALAGNYHERFFLPLWPQTMAAAAFLTGSDAAMRMLTVVLGSINVALAFRLGERVVGEREGFTAAVIMAFLPEHVLFSHYLYAEIFLELFILTSSLVFFSTHPERPTLRRAGIGFLILGIGTAAKHFTVIAWLGLVAAFTPRRRPEALRFLLVSLLFFAPLLPLSAWFWQRFGDPFAIMNIPIKNSMEWNAPGRLPFNPSHRAAALRRSLQRLKNVSLRGRGRVVLRNFKNLWTPNSYASRRFVDGYYEALGRVRGPAKFIGVTQGLILLVGFVGIAMAPPDTFKTYTVASLGALSAMSVSFLLVSRYRIPFAHLLALNGARLFFRRTPFATLPWRTRTMMVLAVVLAAYITVTRWRSIGYWP